MHTKSRAKEAALQRSREEYKPTNALTEHSLYNFYNAGTKPMTVEWSIGQDNTTMELWEHIASTSTTIGDAITNHIHSQATPHITQRGGSLNISTTKVAPPTEYRECTPFPQLSTCHAISHSHCQRQHFQVYVP